jgi:hypothetical protein
MPLLFLIFPLLISCSDIDKFGGSKPELELKIDYYVPSRRPYLYANVYLNDVYLNDSIEYYHYYWIINNERDYRPNMQKEVPYGEHILKFILIDSFGDTLSKDTTVRINEPLKITLLSPVKDYEAEKTDTIKFQYKISGVDTWESEPKIAVYIYTDKDTLENRELLWEKENKIKNELLKPPLNEKVYYWGIKAFTEQDTALSEIRKICIKK